MEKCGILHFSDPIAHLLHYLSFWRVFFITNGTGCWYSYSGRL